MIVKEAICNSFSVAPSINLCSLGRDKRNLELSSANGGWSSKNKSKQWLQKKRTAKREKRTRSNREKTSFFFLWNKMTIKKRKHGRTRILMMRKNRQTDGHDSTERERLDVNIARAYDIAGREERVVAPKSAIQRWVPEIQCKQKRINEWKKGK